MEEEKKDTVQAEEAPVEVEAEPVEKADAPVEEESDFADEAKLPEPEKPEEPEPAPEPEPKKEEKKGIAPIGHEADEDKFAIEQTDEKKKRKGIVEYNYPDERLKEMDDARVAFYRYYRKGNVVKSIVSIVAIALVLLGWIIPTTFIKDESLKMLPMIIALSIGGASIVGMIVYSIVSKRKNEAAITDYFTLFYDKMNSFVLDGLDVQNLEGSASTKITADEFEACGMYEKVTSVGSRGSYTFTYKGVDFALADAAGQAAAGRALRTVFVGKYLRAKNTVHCEDEKGLIIYFKGNDRALPPAIVENGKPIEKNDSYAVYGTSADKKILTPKLRSALKKVHTNNLLVDVAICIKPGKTYFALGYEDTIMVLPMDKPLNPYFLVRFKEDIALFLEIALLLNDKEEK